MPPNLVQPAADVAVVGVGGVRDIFPGSFSAPGTYAQSRSTPRSSKSLLTSSPDFSGHLDRQPGVFVGQCRGRSYINHHPYDTTLCQISLIRTWAQRLPADFTLTETKIRVFVVRRGREFFPVSCGRRRTPCRLPASGVARHSLASDAAPPIFKLAIAGRARLLAKACAGRGVVDIRLFVGRHCDSGR